MLPYLILLPWLCFFSSMTLEAQELRAGDQLPQIEFKNVINYKSSTLDLSRFKGKLLILDFWDFNCISCLEGFYELDSIQREFSDQVQVILVNKELSDQTKLFFIRRPKLLMPHVPFITGDTALQHFFPHDGDPYHVWIGPDGRVLYKADAIYTTVENIDSVLKGININPPPVKKNIYLTSFFDERVRNAMEYYSFISKCDPHIHLESGLEDVNNGIFTCSCYPVIKLFQTVFDSLYQNKYEFSRPGRTVLKIKDLSSYVLPVDGQTLQNWLSENAYDYQVKSQPGNSRKRFLRMKEDLENYFRLDASVQLKNVNCLELVRTGGKDLLHSLGGIPTDHLLMWDLRSDNKDTLRLMTNEPFHKLFGKLKLYIEKASNRPLIDGTYYDGNIDIKMNGDVIDSLNLTGFKSELNKYGLDLVETTRLMNVLVISESSQKEKEDLSE